MGKSKILDINNNMDIVERINKVLKEVEMVGKYKFVEKKNVKEILDCIANSVPEDRLLLKTFKNQVERDWSSTNITFLEDFYKILKYYGIIENDGEQLRKTILEAKGKTIVRKFVVIREKDRVLSLLK